MENICLQITVNSATDLDNVRALGHLKPYVVVFISSKPKAPQKTPVDETGTTNPTWNSTMSFSISTYEMENQNHNVVFQLKCQRSFGGDKLIGAVKVPVKNLFATASSMSGSAQFASCPVINPCNTAKGLLHFSYNFQELLSAWSGSIPMQSVPQRQVSGIGLAGSGPPPYPQRQGSGVAYGHPAAAQLNSSASYRQQFMMQRQGSGSGSGTGEPIPQQKPSMWIPKTELAIEASTLAVGICSLAVEAVGLKRSHGVSGGGTGGGSGAVENQNMVGDPSEVFGLQDGTGNYQMYESSYGGGENVMVDGAAFMGDPLFVDQSTVPDASSSTFCPDISSIHIVPDVPGGFF